MRSRTIIASTLASVVAADNAVPIAPAVPIVPAVPVAPVVPIVPVGGALTGTYLDCVATCKPVLDVSALCGLPVPADPALALNPGAWGAGGIRGAWKRDAGAPAGPGPWGPLGWGGYGGLAGAGVGGGWGAYGGAGLFSQAAIGCVCSAKTVDIVAAEVGCLTCLAKVTTVTNPWLNTLAVGCGVDVAGLAVAAGYPLGAGAGVGGSYTVGANGVATIPIAGVAGAGAGVVGTGVGVGAGINGGYTVNANGQLTNLNGHLIDSAGRLINSAGQLVNAQDQLIDSTGKLINVAPKPASKNVQHDEDDDEEVHGSNEITKRHDGKDGNTEHKDGSSSTSSQSQKGSKPQFSGAEKMMSARGIAGIIVASAAVAVFSLF